MNEGIATFIAPMTLLLGGGLFSVGLLSFLDLRFFKTKFQGKVALAAGLAFVLLTEFIFATSGASGRFLAAQKVDVTDCELDGETALPAERHKDSKILHAHIVTCMKELGYEWTTEHDHCKEGPISTNPYCYLPTHRLARVVNSFQMKFE
ncbi:MAG: hypothetical protein HYS06_10935 [Methylocystis sp.]|nr:hypothetical protein [Methylocystis sp.]